MSRLNRYILYILGTYEKDTFYLPTNGRRATFGTRSAVQWLM